MENREEIPKEKIDKNIESLAKAVEKTYGGIWSIAWRGFLFGLMRAIGSTVGYVLFLGIAIIIAKKLGLLDAVSSFWNQIMDKLPIAGNKEIKIDPSMLDQLKALNKIN